MDKVKRVSRIVFLIALALCFALGAYFLLPFTGATASADGEDAWKENGASLNVGTQSTSETNTTLQWNWKESEVTMPVAFETVQGRELQYIITGKITESVTPANILGKLNNLDAGNYTLEVRTVETTNQLSKLFSLIINKANNGWTEECEMESWEASGTPSEPIGKSLYGTVEHSYEKWNGTAYEGISERPTNEIGKYRVTYSVSEGTNWRGIRSSVEFSVCDKLVTIENLRASDWVWNAFDRNSHISVVSSRDDVTVILTVSRVEPLEGVSPVEFTAEQLRTSTAVSNSLNDLPAGQYTLTARASGEGNGVTGITQTNFRISAATNRWLIPPSMLSWAQNNFKDENLPKAGSLYGKSYLTVTDSQGNSGTEYYSNVVHTVGMSSTDPNGWVITSRDPSPTGTLNSLPGGTYYLHVRVPAEEGKYTGMSIVIPVTVFTGSAERPSNYWVEVPYMNMYTSEYSDPSVPRGYALRWTELTYEYFRAEVDGDDVTLTGDPICVQKKENDGSGTLEPVSGAVPIEPGWYFMRITSRYKENDGTVIALDTLTYDIPFQVREAVNEWTSAPHIPSYNLSDGLPVPTAGSTTYLSDVTFLYKKEGEPDSAAVAQMPVEEGRYIMIATAYALLSLVNDVPTRALYCKPISTEVPFTVSLATNSWVNMPFIDGWSEEFGPNDPTGKAEVGEIVYSYFLSDGVTELKEKPVKAGKYILRATVEEYGYKTLVGEVAFTITPAWDETFLTIDIVLTVVASALTVVAIIFAKRRLSQC